MMKKLIKFVTFKKREQSKWELTYILREEFLFLFEKKKKKLHRDDGFYEEEKIWVILGLCIRAIILGCFQK